jgi:3-oxoacyl-[acyl-carrier protein] reductase
VTGAERKYEGRVAVVTGASRGIGRVITEHLLGFGARVIGISRSPGGPDHDLYQWESADVCDEARIVEIFRKIGRAGDLHFLVNNAAVLTSRPAMLLPGIAARSMTDTNLFGAFLVMREAAKLMHRKRFGRIVSIGSMAAVLEPVGDSMYAATKAALCTMTNVLAREVAPAGITCNTLGISAFATDMLAQLSPERLQVALGVLPQPRCATAEDITNVLDFFLSSSSGGVTAQTVYLGGAHE